MSQLHVVIGGYGRVGRFLAHILEAEGHTVSVIDRNESVLEEIEDDISGQKFTGEVFDREVLELAGIENAHVYAAVTSGDNSNVVSARIARDHFKCPMSSRASTTRRARSSTAASGSARSRASTGRASRSSA